MTAPEPRIDECLQAFLDGDKRAFAPLWRAVAGLVYRVFAGPAQNTPGLGKVVAEELSLEVMEKVFRKLPETSLRPGSGTFPSWLYTVALNHKRDFLARKREIPFSVLEKNSRPPFDPEARGDLGADVERGELESLLRVIRDGLTPEENLLLELRVNEQYGFEEIALTLAGPPPQTERFKKMFYRLCGKIRDRLERVYGADGLEKL